MLMTYEFRKEGFRFEWEDWTYIVRFDTKGARFYDDDMNPIPSPEEKVIRRLIDLLPHYNWNFNNN